MSIKGILSKIIIDKRKNSSWVRILSGTLGISLSYILCDKVYSIDNVIIIAITAGVLTFIFLLIFGFIDKYISKISEGK